MLQLQATIDFLQSNKKVFADLFSHASQDLLRFRQKPGKWNLLEIACHLYDEEREDFRTRLRSVLEDPAKPFPPIDPQGWVLSRRYNEQVYTEVIRKFSEEREASLDWLQSLRKPNWENTYLHPIIGPMKASFILANWVAHDFLHIRQIVRLKYDFLQQESGEKLSYAGNWG